MIFLYFIIFSTGVFVIQENVGNYPNEKRMCKRCWISLSNFHELYCLVKTNYNSFPEEPVVPIIEVIETKTEEEKLRGKENSINLIENELNSYSSFFHILRGKKP